MRIIGGRWRRRLLPVEILPGLRPTPDRARETLFNWLGARLPGAHCLDLFAGSGVLGLEALSRGAAAVVLVERHPLLGRRLREQLRRLKAGPQARLWEAEAVAWLRRAPGVFDIVFLDPPYTSGLAGPCCELLLERGLLTPGARLSLESDATAPPPVLPASLQRLRCRCFGRSRLCLLGLPDG